MKLKTVVISDTHHYHKGIEDFCDRPENHSDLIAANLMALDESYMLIHLGDICMGQDQRAHDEIYSKLRCKKFLVKGNHDNKSDSWYYSNGWDHVCESFSIKRYGKRITFSHKPLPWDGFYDINVHGHLHNLSHRSEEYNLKPWHKLVSVELSNYAPVNLEKLIVNKHRPVEVTEDQRRAVADIIAEMPLPIDINNLFEKDGSHITKKDYGLLLVKKICKNLRTGDFQA